MSGHGRTVGAVLLLIAACAGGALAQAPLPYSETFDSGTPAGWTFSSSSAVVTWAVDATPATGPAPDGPTFGGSAGSLNYNDGTDYDNDDDGDTFSDANFGSATSPVISTAGAGGAIVVSFRCNYNAETGGIWDVRSMDVLDGVSAAVIASYFYDDPFGGGSSASPETDCAAAGTYHLHTHSVAIGAATSVQIRFNFDTVDSAVNMTEGWFVDNLSVTCGDLIAPTVPTLLSPADGSTTSFVAVPLDWSDSTDTTSCGAGTVANYVVEVGTTNPPVFPFDFTSSPATSSVTTTPLVAGVTYFWRVYAVDASGNASAYSSVFSFFIEPPIAPLAPDGLHVNESADGAQGGSPGFVDPVIDEAPAFSAIYRDPNTTDSAIGLRFQVSDDPTFTILTFDSGAVAVSPPLPKDSRVPDLTINVNLARGTVYYWRIQFTDAFGLTGPFSASQSFRIGDDFQFGVRNGSSHHGRRCYVATAAWGPGSAPVGALAAWRSGALERVGAGQLFSRWYGSTGAAMSTVASRSTGLASAALAPFATAAGNPGTAAFAGLAILVVLLAAGIRRF